jgi:hypothetical protein
MGRCLGAGAGSPTSARGTNLNHSATVVARRLLAIGVIAPAVLPFVATC